MRAVLVPFLAFALCPCRAQVVNGSFETAGGSPSLAGWETSCACAQPLSSSDVPGGTGDWSAAVGTFDLSCFCWLSEPVHQWVPWVVPGEWHLSAWIRSAWPDNDVGARVILTDGPIYTPSTLGSIGEVSGSWTFVEDTLVVPVGTEADSLRLWLSANEETDLGPGQALFDQVELTQVISTNVNDAQTPSLAFRPNPVLDRIWVDLSEMPEEVWLLDPLGRRSPIRPYGHHDHTLEVDLSSAKPGCGVLVIRTASGMRTVRFIKT